MIDVRELRIGNYILDQKDRIRRVWTIKQGVVQVAAYDIDEDEINPIPITPEILEKAGIGYDHGVFKIAGLFFIKVGKDGYRIEIWNEQKFFTFNKYIYYVHQLQNLYFLLIGEELKINLNVETLSR